MKEHILNFKNKHNLKTSTPLVLSISGGVDSMVLLDLTKEVFTNLIIVHFNHQIRDQSILEQNLVEKIAKQLKQKFLVFDVEPLVGNFQAQARAFRYKKLGEVAKKNKAKFILTAHHLDDLLETVLMKITRGSNLYGYAGIHETSNLGNHILARPLLTTTKANLLNYAKIHDVSFYTDHSNFLDNYTRNRYRNTIIPIMKQENTRLLENVMNYHIQLTEAYEYIRNASLDFLKDQLNFSAVSFRSLDIVIQKDVLNYLLTHYKIKHNLALILDLVNLITSDVSNSTYHLKNDYHIIKSYDHISFIKATLLSSNNLPKPIDFGVNLVANATTFTLLDNNINQIEDLIPLCYNQIEYPLVIRNRKDGDILEFDYGRKKLKDFLIEKKVPRMMREQLLILVDQSNRILHVDGLYTNKTLGNKEIIYFKFNTILEKVGNKTHE